MRSKSFQVFGTDRRRRWLYLAGGLTMLLAQLSPFVGIFGIDRACSAIAHSRGTNVHLALERYDQDHGAYPENIDGLAPEYLPALPSVCGNDFYLQRCPQGITLLVVSSPNSLGIERLNLETGGWSSIDTLDFGTCDLVE